MRVGDTYVYPLGNVMLKGTVTRVYYDKDGGEHFFCMFEKYGEPQEFYSPGKKS